MCVCMCKYTFGNQLLGKICWYHLESTFRIWLFCTTSISIIWISHKYFNKSSKPFFPSSPFSMKKAECSHLHNLTLLLGKVSTSVGSCPTTVALSSRNTSPILLPSSLLLLSHLKDARLLILRLAAIFSGFLWAQLMACFGDLLFCVRHLMCKYKLSVQFHILLILSI